tara:strand:- start:1 stop:156 length:156 start_codon:yes stop_codon:yes gene_type:complete
MGGEGELSVEFEYMEYEDAYHYPIHTSSDVGIQGGKKSLSLSLSTHIYTSF